MSLSEYFETYGVVDDRKLIVAKKALGEWYTTIGGSGVTAFKQFSEVLKTRFPEVVDRVKLEANEKRFHVQ